MVGSARHPLNAVIVNLDKAPRNARGMVEFSSPFVILKPVDLAEGNHKIFYAINNRGNQQTISYFNFGRGGNNPLTAADVATAFSCGSATRSSMQDGKATS